jgi:hypothetical protein
MPLARIAITLPKEVLTATDRRATELDRSRSRVIVDALRAYLATPAAVREATRTAYGADPVGVTRLEQLERDLAKTPAERLRAAEQAALLAKRIRRSRGQRHQIIGFDSYEDFYEWKKANRA